MGRRLLTGIGIGAVVAAMSLVGVEVSSAASVAPRQVAYVINGYTAELNAFDLASGTVATVPIVSPHGVNAVAIAPDDRHVYATEWDSPTLACVDTSTNYPCAASSATVGTAPAAVAVSPDSTRVYTTSQTDSTVSVIDASTMATVATVPVGKMPVAVAVSPDGKHVYVANASNTMSVIDTATNTVTATVVVGRAPRAVAVTPDGSHVYVANGGANSLSVIDTATNTVTATVALVAQPLSVLVTKDGGRVFVTHLLPSTALTTVSIIDTATNAVTTVTVPYGAWSLANSTDGSHVYAAAQSRGEVSVLDATTGAVTGNFSTPGFAGQIAVGTVVPSTAPAAHLTVTPYSDGGWVEANASASNRGWMTINSYTFDFGDGTVVTQPTPTADHTYTQGGTYTVKVTVSDPASLSSTTSTQTTVYPVRRSISLLSHSNDLYVTAENAGSQPLVANRRAIGAWEALDVLDAGQGKVALRARINGMFVGVDTTHGSQLIANKSTVDTSTLFTIVQNPDGSSSLLSTATGKYVTSNYAQAPMTADRSAIGPWEEFNQAFWYNASLYLHAHANGRYVTAENAGSQPLIANRFGIGQWETFDFVDAGDGYVALLSRADGLFVTAENAGSGPLIANRATIGSWERFKLSKNADGSVSLLSNINGRYVTAENAGALPLVANRTAIGAWEEFDGPSVVP